MQSPVAIVKPANSPDPIQAPSVKSVETPAKTKAQNHPNATLVSVLAGMHGVEMLATDVTRHLTAAGLTFGAQQDGQCYVTALRSAGLETTVAKDPELTLPEGPALAEMTTGQFMLVLKQSEIGIELFDPTMADKRAVVSREEFLPYFTGRTIVARITKDQLQDSHVEQKGSDHWFWGQFGRFRRQIAEIVLGSMVGNLLAVSVALFSLQVYDRVIPHQSQATLWVLSIGALAALTMETLIKIARGRLMDGVGRQIELKTQDLLMQRLLGARSDKRGSPSMMFSAMREFSSVREFFTAGTISTLADIPFILLFLGLVASIAGSVVWVLVLGGILMILPGYFMQKKMLRLTEETQGANTRAGRLLHEIAFDQDTVKSLRAEDRFLRLWNELTALSSLKSAEQRKLASTLTYWSQGVQQATYVTAVIAGTFLVFAGEFTVGSIIATGILTSRTLAPLTQLSGTMARWSNVKGALVALENIAQAEQDQAPGRTYLRRERIAGQFELRNVIFRYEEDGAPTLDVPGIMIQPEQKVALLGVNGAGKSTLLKLLSGLYAPTEGRVLVDGVDLGQVAPQDLRRNIGYLGQEVRLFAGTLRENLNMSLLERDDDRLLEALDFAGLGPFVKGHHKGLDLEIRDGGIGLSVGQRQSIGWARLWLQDPGVVLLDEPTAAMDQALERTMVSRLESWLEGRTAVIATHRMPLLALTGRTMVMQNGRIAVDGPRDKVLEHLTGNMKGEA